MAASGAGSASSDVRDTFATLLRAVDRVSVLRGSRAQQQAAFEPALLALRRLTDVRGDIFVAVQPGLLTWNGETVHSESRDAGFCARLHREGIRSLCFRRGLAMDEIVAFGALLQPGLHGREDAATELWKANLSHLGYSAPRGYQLTGTFGDDDAAQAITEISRRAESELVQHAGPEPTYPPRELWEEDHRSRRDAHDPGELERRGALIIVKIIEQDRADWDRVPLVEAFWRILDQLLGRGEPGPLLAVLEGALRANGPHLIELRLVVGRTLVERQRLLRAIELSALEPKLLPRYLAFLPLDSGPALIPLLHASVDSARAALANAVMLRLESCAQAVDEVLRKGEASLALAVLAAMPSASPDKRGPFAAAALSHPEVTVKTAAIPWLSGNLVSLLGPLLSHPDAGLRLATAEALGSATAQREPAAALLMSILARPGALSGDRQELETLHRALGRLGSSSGFTFLSDRLTRVRRKLFGKRKVELVQLLALQGLAEERSSRSLKALDELLQAPEGHTPAVLAACRAAASSLRAAVRRAGR